MCGLVCVSMTMASEGSCVYIVGSQACKHARWTAVINPRMEPMTRSHQAKVVATSQDASLVDLFDVYIYIHMYCKNTEST